MKKMIATLTVLTAMCWGCDGAGDGATAGEELEMGVYALEMENGGFSTDDGEEDLATFFEGEEEFFEEEVDEGGEGVMEEGDLPVLEEGDRLYRVRLAWGRFPLAPEAENPTQWLGLVAAKGGKVFLHRRLRFESPMQDRARQCKSHNCILINTVTQPHHDGIILSIFVPAPQADAPEFKLVVGFAGKYKRVLTAAELEGLHDLWVVDDAGNAVLIDSHPQGPCPGGFLEGVWKRKNEKGGFFMGKWRTANGKVTGKLAGIWGMRKNGKRVLFGLYVGNGGAEKGLIKGTYKPAPKLPAKLVEGGHFQAHWHDALGDMKGGLKGFYGIGAEAGKGHFVGGWKTACGEMKPGPACDMPELDKECGEADEVCLPEGAMEECKCEGELPCQCAPCGPKGEGPPPAKPADDGEITELCVCDSDDAESPDCTCAID
jgi:hypothetical protein